MNPLGDDLLPLLVLAFGGAMCVGTALALFRPPGGADPPAPSPGTPRTGGRPPGNGRTRANPARRPAAGKPAPPRAPLLRSLLFIAVGAIATIWAAASLLSR
jgi:hypothetical protein